MLNTLLPILLFAALGLAVLGAAKRFFMWRRGRPSKVDWIGGLMKMPRRYLVDLHHVVERSTWHSAQHARQIIAVLESFGIAPDGPLTEDDYAGLPMPAGLWE